MEHHIKKLYPDAKKIMWTHNVVRGGDRFGDQPKAVGGPHLDYHQNKTLRLEYHNRVGPPMPKWAGNLTEGSLLMGEWDTDDSKFGKKIILDLLPGHRGMNNRLIDKCAFRNIYV